MPGVSNYLENELTDHLLRGRAYTAPTTLYVALCTSAPTDASTGATIAEASYTGYARGSIAAGYDQWKGTGGEVTATDSAGTGGAATNNATITIGAAASSGPTVATHFAVLDSGTVGAGNVLWYGALSASKTINSGDPAPTFPVDALSLTITD